MVADRLLGDDVGRCLGIVASIVEAYRYSHVDEYPLQDGVAEVLRAANVGFVRETPIGSGRIDLYVPASSIGIEVKVDGSSPAVTRQLFDYAQDERIDGLLLVTTRSKHLSIAREMHGKPVHIVHLWRGGL